MLAQREWIVNLKVALGVLWWVKNFRKVFYGEIGEMLEISGVFSGVCLGRISARFVRVAIFGLRREWGACGKLLFVRIIAQFPSQLFEIFGLFVPLKIWRLDSLGLGSVGRTSCCYPDQDLITDV